MRRRWRSGWACSFWALYAKAIQRRREPIRLPFCMPTPTLRRPASKRPSIRRLPKERQARTHASPMPRSMMPSRASNTPRAESATVATPIARPMLFKTARTVRAAQPTIGRIGELSVESAVSAPGRLLWHNRMPDERGNAWHPRRLRRNRRHSPRAARCITTGRSHAGISACSPFSWFRRFCSWRCFRTATPTL